VSERVDCKKFGRLTQAQSADPFSRVPDGKVCLNETGELAVTKFAVEPVSNISQPIDFRI
jgi:hypothetical protein